MRNKRLRILCGAMAMLMAFASLTGCSKVDDEETVQVDIEPMEIEEPAVYSFDIIGGNDVMPLIGYHAPLPAMTSYNGNSQPTTATEQFYADMAECGINVLSQPLIDYATAPKTYQKMLDWAYKYGIGQNIYDTNICTNYDLTEEEMIPLMKDYVTHPAYIGNYIYDEPGNAQFTTNKTHMSELVNLAKILNQDIGVWTYVNLVAGPGDFVEDYVGYVKEYCETMNQKSIIFDNYPSFAPGKVEDQSDLIWNMAIVRQFAEEYNMPWWNYIACGGQWNDSRAYIQSVEYYPTEGEFNWNVNTSLAFGAKGINYFAVQQPYWFAYSTEPGLYDFERNCMLGAYGNKNRWFYYVKNINQHIKAIDEYLMNATSKGIIMSVDEKTAKMDKKLLTEENYIDMSAIFEGTSWRELKDISGNVLVGCFNYQGKTALYVVNYSYDYAQKIDLTFVKDCNVKVIQNAETRYAKGKGMTLDMAAGEGVLLIFE